MANQSTATGILSALSDDLAGVAELVRRSVVEVRTANHGGGAGTIWRADGIILTNHHVAPRDRAEVRLADGRELTATVIARDPENDIAALRVQAEALPALGAVVPAMAAARADLAVARSRGSPCRRDRR